MTKEIDYLNEDDVIPNQEWVCMSFLSPEGVRNCKIRGIKVRGVYGTKDEADQRAQELQQIDPDFHIFVGQVGKWLAQDPDPNSITDQQYREKELNKLMKEYKTNLVKTKMVEEERKNDMLQDAIRSERDRKTQTKDRLRRKLQQKQARTEISEFKSNPSTQQHTNTSEYKKIEEKQSIANNERKRIEQNENQANAIENTITKVDDNINKIQELYNSLVKKRQQTEQIEQVSEN